MGDTGSLLIGLINSILVVKFINIAGDDSMRLPLESAPALGMAILLVPLFDTLRVFGLRIFDRRSPFSPDRTHVHHFLLDLGFSHRKVTLLCVGTNVGFILLAFFLRGLGTTTVIGILMALAASLIAAIYYRRNKLKYSGKANVHLEEQIIKSHKILSLAKGRMQVD
jgi:UDP-GlcNAc:undecaprenyl-phosphate GlcNAc-1-phosphate transferase